MSDDIVRKQPVSVEAEQSVLGSVLIDPECMSRIADIMTADDFYLEEHRAIYLAMQELFNKNRKIDLVTLLDTLVHEGVYDKSGGTQYIRTIAEIVPSSANVREYARIVKDKSTLRALIGTCGEISDSAYLEEGDVETLLGSAEQKIFDIAEKRITGGFVHIRDVMGSYYASLQELSKNPGESVGTKTGFSSLDRVLVGMGKGDLVLIGARPGVGKTSFALNIATNVAKSTGKKVCIFSLEMSAPQLVSRMLASEALVDSYKLRTGRINDEEWEQLAHAASALSATDILIDDTTGVTITQMKAKLHRVKDIGLVIIDYLQLMQSDKRFDSRVTEVSDISRNLKLMAKELGVPVICCAQLNRGPENRPEAQGGKRPMLSDLRESGAIEQDADIIMFIFKENKPGEKDAKPMAPQGPVTVEIIVAKNRHGAVDNIKMAWVPQFTQFRTIETDNDLE